MARIGFWVLPLGGYPDTQADYDHAANHAVIKSQLDGVRMFASGDYLACVYDGRRTPWTESDPYPDYVVRVTSTGSLVVERA